MSNSGEMTTVDGPATARGFAVGPVFVVRGDGAIPVPEYAIENGCEGDEALRFRRALFAARRDLENLVSTLKARSGRADAKIFECHVMLLEDMTLAEEAENYILKDRINAEAAVRRTADNARAVFGRMNDSYFRERVRDLDDVERRVLECLMGRAANPHAGLKVPSVIVADDLTPSETVQLPRDLVLGFAMNRGSTTSHVALLARSMGIPAVTGLGDITSRVQPGETVLLDGTAGTVTLSPTAAAIREFRDLVELQREISEQVIFGAPAGTLKEGGEVLLYANLHPGAPLDGIKELGARGIGLYRSEYLWLNKEGEPSEEEQYAAYREVAEFAATLSDRATATIRVLDIGGDKLVRGISQRNDTRQRESNPFLGNRSIRYLLSNPEVFRTQLRAILRASAHGKIRLLYPMISCVEELRKSAEILDAIRRELDAEGIAYDHDIPVGAMIEVPSAAINAASLAKYVSFFSIGTNDLIQYTMAADRGNESVANLYQPTNPAILGLIRHVVDVAKKCGIKVGVCGESAADPIVGVLWAAFGIDMLSMSATYIPVISKLLSKLTRRDLNDYRQAILDYSEDRTSEEILARCHEWMLEKIPDLDNIVI